MNVSLTYIEWCDAVSVDCGWTKKDDIIDWAKNEDWLIHQAGFVVDETDEYILLAFQFNPQQDTEDKYSNVIKIPKTWIKKRVELTEAISSS